MMPDSPAPGRREDERELTTAPIHADALDTETLAELRFAGARLRMHRREAEGGVVQEGT